MSATARPPGGARRAPSGIERATGRDRATWFGVLDEWGAAGRPYRDIADWLTGEHGLSDWWAQKLIVEYEQARGVREAGVRRDGTFEVGASKTIAAPEAAVVAAFREPAVRGRWLPGVTIIERSAESGRPLRFGWQGGPSRLAVTIEPIGPGKSRVTVRHERLPDAATADQTKTFWRERLDELKALLEGVDR